MKCASPFCNQEATYVVILKTLRRLVCLFCAYDAELEGYAIKKFPKTAKHAS